MKKVILRDHRRINPFMEVARDLRILNKPLWLYQRDALARYCVGEVVADSVDQIPRADEPLLVYRDSVFFNSPLMDEFVRRAIASGKPTQVAFSPNDEAVVNHMTNLQDGLKLEDGMWKGELWYYPHGWVPETTPILIDTEPMELGYYQVPHYIVENGNFTYHVPIKAFIPIESWVAVMLTNSLFGVLGWARRLLKEKDSLAVKLHILSRVLLERKHPLATSALVRIGRNCKIDPNVIIHGPTVIGNNVVIGAGSMIVSSVIGDNVNIMHGAQIVLSMVSNGCYIPFRAALYGTSFMENTMVAQNTILQGCVVGRNTFIGGGNVFTDYNLLRKPITTMHQGKLQEVGMAACGCAVGHDCRIGAGFVFYPGRTVESGTILIYKGDAAVVDHNITADALGHDPRVVRLYTTDSLVINEDIAPSTLDTAAPVADQLAVHSNGATPQNPDEGQDTLWLEQSAAKS